MFGLYLALTAVFPGESKFPADPDAAALYVLENLALLPGLTGTPPLIVVTWTLGYEMLLYVTLPLAVRFSGMRDWPAAGRVAALAAAWVGYLAYCAVAAPAHTRLGVYLAAFLAYEAVREGGGRLAAAREGAAAAVAAACVGFVVLMRAGAVTVPPLPDLPGLGAGVRALFLGVGLFALAWCCFGGDGVCSRLLSWTPLRWLGNMSYSFYLTHGLVLKAVALAAATLLPAESRGLGLFWVALPLCYLGALATATVLFVAVEKRVSFPRGPERGAGTTRPWAEEAVNTTDTLSDLDLSQATTLHPALPRPAVTAAAT